MAFVKCPQGSIGVARIQHDVIFALPHMAAVSSPDLLFEDVSCGNPLVNFAYEMAIFVSKAQMAGRDFFEAVWNRQIHCMTPVFAMFPAPG